VKTIAIAKKDDAKVDAEGGKTFDINEGTIEDDAKAPEAPKVDTAPKTETKAELDDAKSGEGDINDDDAGVTKSSM